MADKDILSVLRGIIPIADYMIYTRPAYDRSADPRDLMRAAETLGGEGEVVSGIPEAVKRAKDVAGPKGLILITGSFFTVGEALTCLNPVKYRADGV
jgi:dihydrofolate synthase/folylpolyglutamate synthase